MLKQLFDKEQLSKVINSSDVWQWGILKKFTDVDGAIEHTVRYWEDNNLILSDINKKTARSKTIYTAAKMEDALSIRLLDRFVRRIYKVRQSDRSRIIRQLITILKDSGGHSIIRVDIKSCYESIKFRRLIEKIEDDLIASPVCIRLFKNIASILEGKHGFFGLPRGLSISPTLSELYLEELDNKIASISDVIYSARYVDDIVIVVPLQTESSVVDLVKSILFDMGLELNFSSDKYYCNTVKGSDFDFLGYKINVNPKRDKPNDVVVRISESKIKKMKSRVLCSLCDFKVNRDLKLLKRRLDYLSMLKTVRESKNGNLLSGIGHNYQYVSNNFECLKKIDGFLCHQLINPRFGLTPSDVSYVQKVSFYNNAKSGKIGNFTKTKTINIVKAWKNV